MNPSDTSEWVLPIATVLAAAVGSFVSGRFGQQTAEHRRASERRREAADACVDALLPVRSLLLSNQTERDPREWEGPILNLYNTLDDLRYLMPKNMRHLRRSLRIALGEAVGGIAMADLDSRTRDWDLVDYDARWSTYALEYIDGALRGLRQWRDTSARLADRASVLNFDAWLSVTDRYHTDGEATEWTLNRY